MKNIKHLFTLAIAAIALASCHPLSSTYKALDDNPAPGTLSYTLQPADYKLVSTSVDANVGKALGLTDTAEANKDIPGILNYKFPNYANGSVASITYSSPTTPTSVKLVDSNYSDTAVRYTLTANDYYLLPNNTYKDFSLAQLISWLPYKYGHPKDTTKLKILTWTTYPTNLSPAPPYAFLLLNGNWSQIYMISNAQYASIGRGQYNEFTAADDAVIPNYINAFLKQDPNVSGTAKAGSVEYVTYTYYANSKTYSRVIALTYNGTDWTTAAVPTTNTLTFIKANGTWAPDPTVYYTLTAADCTLIANSTIGGDALSGVRANLAKYDDFEMGTGEFTADLVNQAIILVLNTDAQFKNPKVGVNYKITYLAYTGKDVATTVTFKFDGTNWVPQQ